MSGFLIDTNVISELVRVRPDARVVRWVESADERLLFLSVLTLGEIRKGITALANTKRQSSLETWLQNLALRFNGRVLPIDENVADRWGKMIGTVKSPLPVIDSLLAATALQHNLTLVTRDTQGIAVTGVSLLNPWEI